MKRSVAITIGVLATIAVATMFMPAGRDALLAVAIWAESAPELAWPLYLVLFVLAVVLMFPGWVFMVVGGYLFGLVIGGVLAFVANMAGSVASFFLARTYTRDWIEGRTANSRRFKAFDEAVARNGFTAILFARLALLPNNLLNYACGLTGMRLRDFVLGTSLGCLPILLANVVIGASTMNLFAAMQEGELQGQQPPIKLLAAIIGGLALIVILTKRYGRRVMDRAVSDKQS